MEKRWKRVSLVAIIFLLLIFESVMNLRQPYTPSKEDEQFKYQNRDIEKPLFKKIRQDGQWWYMPNRPQHNAKPFLCKKKPGVIRIFYIGGSVGHLFGSFDLRGVLKRISPDKDFEVICCAMGGYDSYRELLVSRELLRYNPDMIIGFSGNNEFYDNIYVPWRYHLNRFLLHSWLYRNTQQLVAKRAHSYVSVRTQEMVNRQYVHNMSRLAKLFTKRHIPVVLCDVPYNLRDTSPINAPPNAPEYVMGMIRYAQGNYKDAFTEFQKYRGIAPAINYWSAKCMEKLGKYSRAKRLYLESIENDIKGGRLCISQRDALHVTLKDDPFVVFAPVDEYFNDHSSNGITGFELLHDNCHWWNEYSNLVAECLLKTIMVSPFRTRLFLNQTINVSDYLQCDYPTLAQRGKDPDLITNKIGDVIWSSSRGVGYISERALNSIELVRRLTGGVAVFEDEAEIEKGLGYLKELFWTREYVENMETYYPILLAHLGEYNFRGGNLSEALRFFQAAGKNIFVNPLATFGMAMVYTAQGEYNRAENLCKEIDQKDNPTIQAQAGVLQRVLNRLRSADGKDMAN